MPTTVIEKKKSRANDSPRPHAGLESPAPSVERIADFFRSRDLLNRGVCLLNADRIEQAERLFEEAWRLQPVRSLADCLPGLNEPAVSPSGGARVMRTGRPAELERLDDPNMGGDPGARKAGGYVRLSEKLNRERRREEAIAVLRDGIAQSPNEAELQYHLGVLLAADGRYEEAEMRFTQAVALHPRHVRALTSLALCKGVMGHIDGALKNLFKARELDPGSAKILFFITQALRSLKAQGRCLKPMPLIASPQLATLAGTEDEMARWTKAIEGQPTFVEALLSLPFDEAVGRRLYSFLLRMVDTILARRPASAAMHELRGKILARMGLVEEAIEALARAMDGAPDPAPALLESARLHRERGDLPRAVECLERMLALGNAYPDVLFQLGETYRELGRVREAAAAYRKAVRLNPAFAAAREALAAI